MRASVMPEYGPPAVLTIAAVPRPAVEAAQLLVRVAATAVNPADCKQRSGNLRRVLSHRFPCVLGQDFAGVVEAVGSLCTRFAPGDRVYGTTPPGRGCAAEFVAVDEAAADACG